MHANPTLEALEEQKLLEEECRQQQVLEAIARSPNKVVMRFVIGLEKNRWPTN